MIYGFGWIPYIWVLGPLWSCHPSEAGDLILQGELLVEATVELDAPCMRIGGSSDEPGLSDEPWSKCITYSEYIGP